jgi:hypothetical protein
VPTQLAGFVDDTLAVLKAFAAMARGFCSMRVGKAAWNDFTHDLDRKRSISVSPKVVVKTCPLSARDQRRSPRRRTAAPHCQSRRMAQDRGITATIAAVVPATAAGRIGVLSSIDLEKVAGLTGASGMNLAPPAGGAFSCSG